MSRKYIADFEAFLKIPVILPTTEIPNVQNWNAGLNALYALAEADRQAERELAHKMASIRAQMLEALGTFMSQMELRKFEIETEIEVGPLTIGIVLEKPDPIKINMSADPATVLDRVMQWAKFFHNDGAFNVPLKKNGQYYSIDDVFYNIPHLNYKSGVGQAGDIRGKKYTCENGTFVISIMKPKNKNRDLIIDSDYNLMVFEYTKKDELKIYLLGKHNKLKGNLDHLVTFVFYKKDFYKKIGYEIYGEYWKAMCPTCYD